MRKARFSCVKFTSATRVSCGVTFVTKLHREMRIRAWVWLPRHAITLYSRIVIVIAFYQQVGLSSTLPLPMTMESNAETMSAKRLRLGLLLAWTPLMFFIVPTAIGIIGAIAQMSTQNATGLGAVAGGFTEVVATFGLVVIVASEVAAIVMLLRTLSRSHPVRTTVAVISICCSGLLLLALGLFLWGSPAHQWR